MADNAPATPPKPARSRPWGYLVMAAAVLGLAAVVFAAPDILSNRLGSPPPRPSELGEGPARAGDVAGGQLSEREVAAEMSAMGRMQTAAAPAAAATAPAATAAKTAAVQVGAEEALAAKLLAEVERSYAAMEFERAASGARRVAAMDAMPATKGRAMDIERNAPLLLGLFKELDDRDELNRNWETHPSLLRLSKGTSTTLAVPITTMEAPFGPVLDNPVGWVESQRSAGKVKLLVKGAKQFTAAEMEVSEYGIALVDQAAQTEANRKLLAQREARLGADPELRRDATAWYELGKFAYRNRLDDQVVRFLDQAIDRDPALASSVREGNAALLFGSMVTHIKNGNRQQAAAFMVSIDKRYKGTEQARQARLYFDGKTAELVAAAREADARAKADEEARRQARLAQAKRKGDTEAAQKIEAETAAATTVAPTGPVSADIAKARENRDKASQLLGEAMNLPPTDERNRKYHDAAILLATAKSAFAAYCTKNPGDGAAEGELLEISKMLFMAKKYQTL